MKLEPETKNALALVLCIIGLVGIAYSLWNILLLSDLKMIPSLVVSVMCIIGGYAFLIKDNDKYPGSLGTILYFILILGLFFWGIASAYFSANIRDTGYILGISIFVLVLFFAGIFENLWRNRTR
jgi:FtsH-binding integral membrane protein